MQNNFASPHLPVLNKLIDFTVEHGKPAPLKNTAIVCVMDTLPTVLPLLHAFVQLGAQPKKIFTMGKLYSECEDTIQKIMQAGFYYQRSSSPTALGAFHHSYVRDVNTLLTKYIADIAPTDNLLILDHGGHLLTFAPGELIKGRKVVGIEKTTAGLLHPEVSGVPFPVIRMADCVTKTVLESPLIAEEIVEKLVPFLPIQKGGLICGVVGYGAIGKAITDKLVALGHKVIVYDHVKEKMQYVQNATKVSNLSTLVANSDYILDCTGNDISVSVEILNVTNAKKTLISCSSEDKAFRSLLQYVHSKYSQTVPRNCLDEITFKNEMGFVIRILRGGFPINFDNISEASPPEDIQLTRALVLAGVIQATQFFDKPALLERSGSYMLDPILQKFLAQEWLKCQPKNRYPQKIIESFRDIEWIMKKSGGKYESCPISQKFEECAQSVGHLSPVIG